MVTAEKKSGAGDIIFLLNDDGPIPVENNEERADSTLTLKCRQRLLGVGDHGGSLITLPEQPDFPGQTFRLTINSDTGRPTLVGKTTGKLTTTGAITTASHTDPGRPTIHLADDNQLQGFSVSGGEVGIANQSQVSNVAFRDVKVSDTASTGIFLQNPGGLIHMTDVSIDAAGNGGLVAVGGYADFDVDHLSVTRADVIGVGFADIKGTIELTDLNITIRPEENGGTSSGGGLAVMNNRGNTLVVNGESRISAYGGPAFFAGSASIDATFVNLVSTDAATDSAPGFFTAPHSCNGIFLGEGTTGALSVIRNTVINTPEDNGFVIDSANVDVTLQDVKIDEPGGDGMRFTDAAGKLEIANLNVIETGGDGIAIRNSPADVYINNEQLHNANIVLTDNSGSFAANNTNIQLYHTTKTCLFIHDNSGQVSLNNTYVKSQGEPAGDGIIIDANTGEVFMNNTTVINNSAPKAPMGNGVIIRNSTGSTQLNNLNIDDVPEMAIQIKNNNGSVGVGNLNLD